jgi:hypothetical protein
LPLRDQYLSEILKLEAPPYDGKCQDCKVNSLKYRCHDCFGRPSLCKSCCLNRHRHLPFHKIEFWNGSCFLPSDLQNLGLVLHLGHGGDPCPCYKTEKEDDMKVDFEFDVKMGGSTKSDREEETDSDRGDNTGTKLVCIVHSSGVYHRNIRFCKCQNSPDKPFQLLSLHLFPSSFSNPETIFTFDVLDHFYIDAMECKTSAGSFFSKLRRLSSNAFPEQVPVSDIKSILIFHSSYLHLFTG